MRFRYTLGALVVAALVVTHAIVGAQVRIPTNAQRVRSAPIQVARLVTARPIHSGVGAFTAMSSVRGTTIFGIVQNHVGVLVPSAGVVLIRELVTGNVVARTTVDELAQFSFQGLPSGLYSAELVGGNGTVLASSPAFNAAVGEVIQISQTIQTLPVQGLGQFASSATSSALSTAASSGVLAVTEGVPVSPGQ